MIRLGFACDWSQPRSQTWSGIPHALEQALERQLANSLHDMDLRLPGWKRLMYTIMSMSRNPYNGHLQNEAPQSPLRQHALQARFRRAVGADTGIDALLSISDYCPTPGLPQYLYFDLCIPAFRALLNNPELARVERVHYREKYLQQREDNQRAVYRAARGLFAVSHFAARGAAEAYALSPESLHVVGAGATATALESCERMHERDYILVVGKDPERKAIPLVMQAYAKLRERREVDLIVIGPTVDELKDYRCEGIHILGSQPKDVVQRYFHHARLFVLPSYFEAYGLVFAEALVHGIPVIARNCCAMPEIITEGVHGYLLPEKSCDAAELAGLMSQALSNTAMSAALRAGRSKAAEYYSWDRVARDIVTIIESDLNASGRTVPGRDTERV